MERLLASARTRKRIEAMINGEVAEVDRSMHEDVPG
jgi:hypothetical protein